MKNLVAKLLLIKDEVSAQEGDFTLFALILPKNSTGGWDLMVAAPWIKSQKEGLDFFSELLKARLTNKEILQMSRIIILHQDSATLKRILQEASVSDGVREIKNTVFFGLPIEHAYILASRKPKHLSAAH